MGTLSKYMARASYVNELLSGPDERLIGVAELALILGYSESSIQQRRVRGVPIPFSRRGRRLLWQLGHVREFLKDLD